MQIVIYEIVTPNKFLSDTLTNRRFLFQKKKYAALFLHKYLHSIGTWTFVSRIQEHIYTIIIPIIIIVVLCYLHYNCFIRKE